MLPIYLSTFLVALLVAAGSLPAIMRFALRLDAVDRPGGRRLHTGHIPRLGGIGIFLGVGAGVGMALILGKRAVTLAQPEQYGWYGPALGMLIVFLGGVLDDVRQFSPRTKFFIQTAGALVAVMGGTRIDAIAAPWIGTVELGWLGGLAALAWLLLTTNAMNLMDGLDGLAGGLAFIVAATLAAISGLNGQFAMVVCSFALAGAVLGFLVYNFEPARVFMGDGGSQFLGFFVGIVAIRSSQKGPTAIAILVPLLALGLPLLDLGTTIARRALRPGENGNRSVFDVVRRVTRADRGHLHHNLLEQGLTPRRAVLALYAVAVMFAVSAYLSVATKSLPVALLTLTISVGCVVAIKASTARVRSWRKP